MIFAEIAQLVEHNLAKVGVASSSLVFRSKSKGWLNASLFDFRRIMLATSDPKSSLSGVGGVNNSSREMPTSIVGSSLVFRSRNDRQPFGLSFFYRFLSGFSASI